MKVWLLLIIFLVGLGFGLAAPSVAPKYLGSYFPKSLAPSHSGVQGIVVRRQLDEDRLLLTISAPDGALLATFQKKIAEISLLIDEGDSVTLDVRAYAPFVNDPPILRVKKPDSVSSPIPSVVLPESFPDTAPEQPLLDPIPPDPESSLDETQLPISEPDLTGEADQQL